MKLLCNPEFIRRLALALGLFISIMMYSNSVGSVYIVDKPDFDKMHQQDYTKKLARNRFLEETITKRPNTISKQLLERLKKQQKNKKPIRKMPLDEFIAEKTKGNTKEVSGPEWQSVVKDVNEHYLGRTPEKWLKNTKVNKSPAKDLYFPQGEEPFASVAPGIHKELFLAYDYEGVKHYLRIHHLPANRASDAYDSLLHPWRAYSWAPFALGLVLYLFLLPKVVRPAGAWGHPRLWGVMLSDFFSLFFAGLFFWLGFLAISEHDASVCMLFSLEARPMFFVFSGWILGLVFLGGMWFGISYRNFWIMPSAQGLEIHTCKKTSFYPYQEMKQAALRIKDHAWMVQIMLLLGGHDAGTFLMAQSHNGRVDARIEITMKDGEIWQVKLAMIGGGIPLVKTLRDNRVEIDSDLARALEEDDEVRG